MTTFAPTARPALGAIAWVTKDALMVEIPCKDGPPYLTRFPKTVTGLSQALSILIANEDTGATPKPSANHPAVKRAGAGTPPQREAALDVLKRLKLVP